MPRQGVIEKSTGDLLRAGYQDFSSSPEFDSGKEEIRTDVPKPWYVRGSKKHTNFHRWTGSAWTLVSQGLPISESELQYRVQKFSGFRLWKDCYFTDEINSPTGFSGFSGLGKEDEYMYSGTNLMGFSSRYYDTAGQVISSKLTNLSTGANGERIFREIS